MTDDVPGPAGPLARLGRAFARYAALAWLGGWPAIPDGPRLDEGDDDPRVPILRQRLAAEGLPTTPEGAPTTFDAGLAAAVRAFQDRHALDVDGVVGPRTRAALDVDVGARLAQLADAAERLSAVDLGDRIVIVDLGSFLLHGLQDGVEGVTSRVVIGAPEREHRTPELQGAIRQVVFGPSWNVPSSIAPELLPAGPDALRDQGFDVVTAAGARLPPTDASLAEVAAGRARLRQRPGADNALGAVKFVFPNPHGVYLHDTPSQRLFERGARAFSHGCVRVAAPRSLAAWLLAPAGWTEDAVAAAIDGRSRDAAVTLSPPVPVVLVDLPAWVDEDGAVRFGVDAYRRW